MAEYYRLSEGVSYGFRLNPAAMRVQSDQREKEEVHVPENGRTGGGVPTVRELDGICISQADWPASGEAAGLLHVQAALLPGEGSAHEDASPLGQNGRH